MFLDLTGKFFWCDGAGNQLQVLGQIGLKGCNAGLLDGCCTSSSFRINELVEEIVLSSPDDDLVTSISRYPVVLARKARNTYLVVYVSYIHYKLDIELEVIPHDPPNDICRNIVPRMSHMRIIVDGWSASIPCHCFTQRI